jgi:EmrB/QacA subfamily drug resistance transporter
LQYKWVALSTTTIGILMASLDVNIVLIALPTIAKELRGTPLIDLLWVLLGYQLVTASVLVNFGRLADMFGRVRLFNFGFATFTVGSALCSLSQTGSELVAFRMVQAVGAAFLFSNSAAILTDAFPPNERGKALGVNQVSIVAGSVSGLVLGGILSAAIGWQSIFWVNVPIGIFATLWSRAKLHEIASVTRGQRVDFVGNFTFAGAIVSLLLAVTLRIIENLALAFTVVLILLSGALFCGFILAERRVEAPMFDLSLFRIRQFAAGNLAILLNALARGAVTLTLVFYLQGPTMHLNPFVAGLFLTPTSASLATFGPISGWLSDRYGARILSSIGLVVAIIGFLMLATIGRTVTFAQLALPLIFVGSGMGIFAAPNRASIMNAVAPEVRGIASGVSTTLVNLGNMFSLAIAFLIMASVTPIGGLVRIFVGQSGVVATSDVTSFIDSIHLVYTVSTGILLLALIPSLTRGKRTRTPEVVPEVDDETA